MRLDELDYLRCPGCGNRLTAGTDTVTCSTCDRSFPIEAGIPKLLLDAARLRQSIQTLDVDMRRHHWVVAQMSLATLTWVPAQRVRLLKQIGVQSGQTLLDHCTGRGDNLPTLAGALGPSGKLVAMDLSDFCVHRADALIRRQRINADIHQADASALPYAAQMFDVVVHYGALNQFGEGKQRAIDEILRVTKPGGLVVLLDEGIVENRRNTWWGRTLIRRNPLFGSRPPVDLLPPGSEPRVRWVIRGMFYEIRLHKPR